MGNTQTTPESSKIELSPEEQKEIDETFKKDLIQHVIHLEKNVGLLYSFDLDQIYMEVLAMNPKHRHHMNYKKTDDFIKLVSENLRRPHVIYSHHILFVVNPTVQSSLFPAEQIHFATQESKTAEQIRRDFADRKRQNIILSIQPARKLKSEFFNRSNYYYSDEKDTVYEIESDPSPTLRSPSHEIEKMIRELNDLPAK